MMAFISGSAMAAPLRWVCNGSSTKEGEWLSITHTSNSPNWYSGMTLLIDGASTPGSKALKMQSDTKIIINLTKKANVTIGVTTKNNNAIKVANAKIKFDGTASESILEEDQKASTGVYTSKEITYTNVAAGEHTITRNSSELGVYYIKVDYDTNDQPYTVTFNQNGATSLTETAANAGIVLPGLKNENVAVPTFGWSRADNVTNADTYRDGQFAEGYWEFAVPAGDVIHQTAIGLTPGGKYLISLSAAASYADWSDFGCFTGDNLTKVFAGDQETFIPVVTRRSVAEGEENTVTFLATADSDGKLKYGIKNVTPSGNWYIIKVNSITKCDGTDGLLGWYDTNGNKVGDAGQTIYPEADMTLKAKYAYTLKSVIKNSITELETVNGEAFDGEAIPVKKYLTKDGILYNTPNNNPGTYYGITLNQPGEYKKDYTAVNEFHGATIDGSENARVVFLAEAEDIQGFGRKTDDNVKARCSNLYGGEVRNYPAVITSLPNGQYRIFAGVRGNSSTTYKIYVNDEEKASEEGTGSPQEFGTDVVELNQKSTEIKAGLAAGSSVWDFFIIVKTGDAVVECPHTIYEGDVIGETDNSSAWWRAHSKQFELSKGNSRTFTFTSNNFDKTTSASYEKNWGFIITNILGHNGDVSWNSNGGKELFALSGSASNWGVGTPNIKFYRGTTQIGAGGDDEFFTDMASGPAETTISVSYAGKRIYLQGKIRTSNGQTYTIYDTSEEIDKNVNNNKVYMFFAVANNHFTNFQVTEEQPAYQVISIPGLLADDDAEPTDATDEQGTVSIKDADGIDVDNWTYVAYGTSLTFTATPGTEYIFSRWANNQTDATRIVTYDQQYVMYSYFKPADGVLTVAKPADLTIESGTNTTLTANAQWAGGDMPATGATYSWYVKNDNGDTYEMPSGQGLTTNTFNYHQDSGHEGRWYYHVVVTYNGKTEESDWAKLIVKGGHVEVGETPVTVTFTADNNETNGYVRTDADKYSGSKDIDGVRYPVIINNEKYISVTEKGAKYVVISTRKGGGSGNGQIKVYFDDDLVETIDVLNKETKITERIKLTETVDAGVHTVKIVGSSQYNGDLSVQYVKLSANDKAQLNVTSAEVKMRQPLNIDLVADSQGEITMLSGSTTEFFDASLNNGVLTITPKKAGTGTITFAIAANDGYDANDGVTFDVTVRKQNITMVYEPDSYIWNYEEQATAPAFVKPQLYFKDENGKTITDYEFTGITYGVTDETLVNSDNGDITIHQNSQGSGIAAAKWPGDENYNTPEYATYTVSIIQGVSFKTALSGQYKVGDKGYLTDNGARTDANLTEYDKEKLLLTFTYGGWNLASKDNSYKDAGGKTLTDSWKKGTQEDKKLFPPVDPDFLYHSSGTQNAKSETFPTYGNFTAGDVFSLPVRGAYMTFEPTVNGTLSVYILQNGCLNGFTDTDKKNNADGYNPQNDAAKPGEFASRSVFVVDGEGHNVEDYTVFKNKTNQTVNAKYYSSTSDKAEGEYYYLVTDPSDPRYDNPLNVATWSGFKSLSPKNQEAYKEGWNSNPFFGTQEIVRLENGSYSAIQKGMMKYTFYVAAGQTYYIFANSSKIGFVGCNFVKDEEAKQPTQTLALSETMAYNPGSLEKEVGSSINVPMYKTVTLGRSFTAGNWNTICLPFTMTEQEVEENFGKGTELIILDNVNIEGDKATIHFTYHEIQSIVAGFPYLIKPAQDCGSISVSNKIINPDTQLTTFASNGYTSKGIDGFCTANISNGKGNNNYSHQLKAGDIFLSSNTLYISKGASYLKGYRAYIDAPVGAQVASISFEYGHAWDEDEEPTAIGIAEMDPEVISTFGGMMQGVYNLNGQKVANSTDNLPKGIYIVNGQKVTVE